MKKVLNYVLIVLFFTFLILFLSQAGVKAEKAKTLTTIEELKDLLGDGVTINDNTIILNEDTTLEGEIIINIENQDIVIDFNGKKLTVGMITIVNNKFTLRDSLGGGGMLFNATYAGIMIEQNAMLEIYNGRYEDTGVSNMFVVKGKFTINDGEFISTDENPDNLSRTMIALYRGSETIINGGNFVDTDYIIKSNIGDYKLTINGGNFKGTGDRIPIELDAVYPYLVRTDEESSVFPTIIFNDCTIEGKKAAVLITCGTSDENLTNINEKAVIFNGGTYNCTGSGFALEIATNLSGYGHFNPYQIEINNGTFEALSEYSRSN